MNRQTTLLILFAAALGGIIYVWYQYTRGVPEEEEGEVRQTRVSERLQELRRLKDIQLDTSIFKDEFFRTLVLPTPAPAPQSPPGRPNPFAPLTPEAAAR